MRRIALMLLSIVLLSGCAKPTEPQPTEPQPTEQVNNRMSFSLNGSQHVISIFSQPNAYVQNEIVLRGSGEGLENTLMLTFRPVEGGFAVINREMTGYWDLGLCIPFKKYLLANDSSNYIRIDTYDKSSLIVKGKFKLTFRFETDTTKIASFSNGTFLAKVDSTYPFRYCIEG